MEGVVLIGGGGWNKKDIGKMDGLGNRKHRLSK